MNPENKKKIAKMLSLIVIAAGIAVMAGWIFDIGLLKSIFSGWISMKLSTAFTFCLSGISLYYIVRAQEGEFESTFVVLPMTSLFIILIMGTMFFSAFVGVHTGIEDLFIKETGNTVMTVTPGSPTMPTMICFILIAVAGILTSLNVNKQKSKLKAIGIAVFGTGALAAAGYIFNVPLFYYYIPDVNSAMALHTSVLFMLSGAGLLCL